MRPCAFLELPTCQNHRRMRAVEESLFETLGDLLLDETTDDMADATDIPECREALYDHPDYGVLLDLALNDHRVGGQTVIERHFDESKRQPARTCTPR